MKETTNSVFCRPLALDYVFTIKPCVSRRCLRAIGVWFPVTSVVWAAIIYGASKLVR
jgi:hypothetical protein